MRAILPSGVALLAFVSAVLAQTTGFDAIYTPTKNEVVAAGSTYQVTWDYAATYAGTISIQLLQGSSPTTLQLGAVIASGLDNSAGSYSWAVDSSLGADATYGLKITLDSDSTVFQYSNPFQISAASAGSSSSSAAAAATTAALSTTEPNKENEEAKSTLYSTQYITVTSCAATVTNCPARSTIVSSSLVPVVPTSSAQPAKGTSTSVLRVTSTGFKTATISSSKETAPVYPVSNSTTSYAAPEGTVTLGTSAVASTALPSSTTGAVVTAGAGRTAAGLIAGLVAGFVAVVFAF